MAAGLRGDAARRLSRDGRERMRRGAVALAKLVPAPEEIWSSPLVRARETAALLAEAFGVTRVNATPLLAPGFDARRLVAELESAGGRSYAIVGHEPDVSGLAAWLIGAAARDRIRFGAGAAALVEFAAPGAATLRAFYPLETFAPENPGRPG